MTKATRVMPSSVGTDARRRRRRNPAIRSAALRGGLHGGGGERQRARQVCEDSLGGRDRPLEAAAHRRQDDRREQDGKGLALEDPLLDAAVEGGALRFVERAAGGVEPGID